MNADARLTLYGGTGIGSALLALGAVTAPSLALTGLCLMGAALAVAIGLDQLVE